MSSKTSSRSTLTMVPSTMSPSLKYLMVLSIAAMKSSAEPMSLMATCGEVMEGLGMWWVAPDRFYRRDSCCCCVLVLHAVERAHGYPKRLLAWVHAGQTWVATQRYAAFVPTPSVPQAPRPVGPPLPRKIRKVGAPLGAIIAM